MASTIQVITSFHESHPTSLCGKRHNGIHQIVIIRPQRLHRLRPRARRLTHDQFHVLGLHSSFRLSIASNIGNLHLLPFLLFRQTLHDKRISLLRRRQCSLTLRQDGLRLGLRLRGVGAARPRKPPATVLCLPENHVTRMLLPLSLSSAPIFCGAKDVRAIDDEVATSSSGFEGDPRDAGDGTEVEAGEEFAGFFFGTVGDFGEVVVVVVVVGCLVGCGLWFFDCVEFLR
mmetsp:Transcript_12836/g.26302  ORF Transcript_12836/g.26302 Transcript_12836/m.26302 type:complete len:230 (-) Transcript_12836:375-1064(-)